MVAVEEVLLFEFAGFEQGDLVAREVCGVAAGFFFGTRKPTGGSEFADFLDAAIGFGEGDLGALFFDAQGIECELRAAGVQRDEDVTFGDGIARFDFHCIDETVGARRQAGDTQGLDGSGEVGAVDFFAEHGGCDFDRLRVEARDEGAEQTEAGKGAEHGSHYVPKSDGHKWRL